MKKLVLFVFLISLTGCGSGSTSSNTNPPPPPPPPIPATSPSFVQAVSVSCSTGISGTQCSNTFPITITTKAGNAILVPLWFNALNVTVQISDSNNDAFELWGTVPTTDLNDSPAFLYAARNVTGGAVTINLSFTCGQAPCNPQSGVPASVFAGALEYQGITHGMDASVTSGSLLTQQTQSQQIDSGTFTSHLNNELAFGIGMADFGLQVGSGWTARLGCNPSKTATSYGGGYFCFEEQSASQIGSFDATFVTDFSSAGGLGGPPSPTAPNGYGISALSIY
jgi:hypothetical protein